MAEYIVGVDEKRKVGDPKIDPLAYLHRLPVLEEIIRCRDCKGSEDGPWHKCETFLAHGEDPDGFCAWAECDTYE